MKPAEKLRNITEKHNNATRYVSLWEKCSVWLYHQNNKVYIRNSAKIGRNRHMLLMNDNWSIASIKYYMAFLGDRGFSTTYGNGFLYVIWKED